MPEVMQAVAISEHQLGWKCHRSLTHTLPLVMAVGMVPQFSSTIILITCKSDWLHFTVLLALDSKRVKIEAASSLKAQPQKS